MLIASPATRLTASIQLSSLRPWRALFDLALLLTVWLCGHAPCTAQGPATGEVVVTATRMGSALLVEARALVIAPNAVIWETLTDYNGFANFIPGMLYSRLMERRGNLARVEQRGESRVAFVNFPIQVMVVANEHPPHRIELKLESGNLRQLEGAYQITPQPGENLDRHVLVWKGIIEPEGFLPPLLGELVLRSNLEDQFRGMVSEIARRAAAATLPGSKAQAAP